MKGKPQIVQHDGVPHLRVVTELHGEESVDLFSFDELREFMQKAAIAPKIFNLKMPLSKIAEKAHSCRFFHEDTNWCIIDENTRHYLKGGYDLIYHCQNCTRWKRRLEG